MSLEWKKLYMVQELWSDTFHLTARILMQKREVITRPKTSFEETLPSVAAFSAMCLSCMFLRKFVTRKLRRYFRNSGYE